MVNSMIARGVAVLSFMVGVNAIPAELLEMIMKAPNPPVALRESASANEIKYQPVLDYDTDSCYNVPAIDSQGNVVEGLDYQFVSLTSDCRDTADLDNQNVYVRSLCNNGWCAYMYEHYFEKDVPIPYGFAVGHRHDWENIVVMVKDGDEMPSYVSPSAHDGYQTKPASEIRFQGTHAKIVYHKDGIRTHAFRFANADDDNIENAKGVWIRGALVGWSGFPSTYIRDRLIAGFASGGIKPKLDDTVYGSYLAKAIGDRIPKFSTSV